VFVQGAHYFRRVDPGKRIAKQTRAGVARTESKFIYL